MSFPACASSSLRSPYRHQGLGSKLIHHVLSTAAESLAQPKPAAHPPAATSAATTSSTASSKPNGTSAAAAGKGPAPKKAAKVAAGDDEKEKEQEQEQEPLKPRVESVYLHVQVGNDEAKRFWEKWGFEVKVRKPSDHGDFLSFLRQGRAVAYMCGPPTLILDCDNETGHRDRLLPQDFAARCVAPRAQGRARNCHCRLVLETSPRSAASTLFFSVHSCEIRSTP